MIVAVGRFTPTDVYPPTGDDWRAFSFADEGELRAWLDDAGLWYPDALILTVDETAGTATIETPPGSAVHSRP